MINELLAYEYRFARLQIVELYRLTHLQLHINILMLASPCTVICLCGTRVKINFARLELVQLT
jgi:hypothetical protein